MNWIKINNVELNVSHYASLSEDEFMKQAGRNLSIEASKYAYNKIQELKKVKKDDDKSVPTIDIENKPIDGSSGSGKRKQSGNSKPTSNTVK